MKNLLRMLCLIVPVAALGAARITDPRMPESAPKRISAHAYEIESFPNIGIVVGSTGTLVIDTGLGPRNGAVVAAQAKKLAPGNRLYLTTTHFHPEHAGGDSGFPADTTIIRSRVQQEELAREGERGMAMFRRNPSMAEFIPADYKFRQPDVLFDRDHTLDLGGVHARIELIGPAHTVGDQVVWVPEDRTLFTGDLAMNNDPPRFYATGANATVWISALDRLAALQPLHVVPDHGDSGDLGLIRAEREFLTKNPTPAGPPPALPGSPGAPAQPGNPRP